MSDDTADRMSSGPPPLEYVPPPARVSRFRRLLACLPGFCSHCGKRYVRCSAPPDSVTITQPLPGKGRCCPDSHEGYIDTFNAFAGVRREWNDNVRARRLGR